MLSWIYQAYNIIFNDKFSFKLKNLVYTYFVVSVTKHIVFVNVLKLKRQRILRISL